MGFFDWLAEPFLEGIFTLKKEEEEQEKEEEIIEKKIILPIKKIYRPETFEDYIGQNKAKDILKSYIIGTRKRSCVFPHTLIHGSAGYGKTTLARLIAIYLGVKYCTLIASSTAIDEIKEMINLVEGGIVFVDEIHGLKRDDVEKLYSILEDFTGVIPFTMIGATTELGEIIKDKKPFFDRFKILIELERYTLEDLIRMASLYKNRLFDNENIKNGHYISLAKNCRGTPRTLIRLLEALVYLDGDIKRVLNNFSIIKDGFTLADLKILEYIKLNQKGVGLSSLANYLDTSQENYVYYIEPYLLQTGVLLRTGRGRVITEKGIQLLEELKNAY